MGREEYGENAMNVSISYFMYITLNRAVDTTSFISNVGNNVTHTP